MVSSLGLTMSLTEIFLLYCVLVYISSYLLSSEICSFRLYKKIGIGLTLFGVEVRFSYWYKHYF